MATTNTTKNPPKSTPILLSTAIVDRASGPWIPRCFGHPPRSATPPGGAAARARHASGRLSRRAPSAATQERVADPEPPPKALAAAAARPLAAASTTAPTPWLRGRRAAFQRGTVRPPAAPRPSSRPALPSHLPRACPSGLCCWLLLLAAGCWCCWRPPRPAGGNLWPSRTIFAVSHPPMAPGWGCGHSLGQSGRS